MNCPYPYGAPAASDLDSLFNPRSIAIVGASANPTKMGHQYLRQLLHFGFEGKLYPVNRSGGAILGVPVCRSFQDIPGPVDYVISAIPADQLPQLIRDSETKGVKLLQLYTAHLGETEQGKGLEAEIIGMARRAGIRILGPNCMGIYYPERKITFRMGWPREAGDVGLISQSAGHTAEAVYRAARRGLRFSKVISFGNAADINEVELLRYLADDADTRIIAAYVEGLKAPRLFHRALETAAKKKPVVIMKGGRTDAGKRATLSHTGSLTGGDVLWHSMVRQCGAVAVSSIEDLVDITLAIHSFPQPGGVNVGCIGAGGGVSVSIADECESRGLAVPPLPGSIVNEIRKLLGKDSSLVKNPVDTSVIYPAGWTETEVKRIFQFMGEHPDFHLFLVDGGEWPLDSPETLHRFHESMAVFREVARGMAKPVAIVVRPGDATEEWRWKATLEAEQRCIEDGLTVYPSIQRAANALTRLVGYYQDKVAEG
ncbi:MAG: CoA-binding protein [Chloroflexi bacterium]|nr:CoA-binding protein [Chloroflexota bacterium]